MVSRGRWPTSCGRTGRARSGGGGHRRRQSGPGTGRRMRSGRSPPSTARSSTVGRASRNSSPTVPSATTSSTWRSSSGRATTARRSSTRCSREPWTSRSGPAFRWRRCARPRRCPCTKRRRHETPSDIRRRVVHAGQSQVRGEAGAPIATACRCLASGDVQVHVAHHHREEQLIVREPPRVPPRDSKGSPGEAAGGRPGEPECRNRPPRRQGRRQHPAGHDPQLRHAG